MMFYKLLTSCLQSEHQDLVEAMLQFLRIELFMVIELIF